MESDPSTTQVTTALPQRRRGGDFEDMDAAYNPSDVRGVSRPAYLAPCIIFPAVHHSVLRICRQARCSNLFVTAEQCEVSALGLQCTNSC